MTQNYIYDSIDIYFKTKIKTMSEIQRNDPIEKDPVTMDDGWNMDGMIPSANIWEWGDDVTPLDTWADEAKLTPEQQEEMLLQAAIAKVKESGMPLNWVKFIEQQAQKLSHKEAIQSIKNALANWESGQEARDTFGTQG